MKKNHNITYKTQKGFTLLFAILISTLVVSIGATIISIALRQTILSGTNRESNYAFYAANTALECATYWDKKGVSGGIGVVFPAPESANGTIPAETPETKTEDITCSGVNIVTGIKSVPTASSTQPWKKPTVGETTFYITVKDLLDIKQNGKTVFSNAAYCAEATVEKSPPDALGIVTTTIEARGYNTCDTTNPRRVERGIIEQYQS